MQTTPNQLPDLSSDYPLLGEAVAAYRRAGHVLLTQVLAPAEVAAYRPVLSAATQQFNTEQRPMAERDTYAKAFLQIMNLWVRDEACKRFAFARRFAKIAAKLMGVDGVRMYHDQALYKEAGGGHTPWHQDQYYWPLNTDHTITMWMPLVDLTEDMGILQFASGSHLTGYLGKLPISDKSDEVFQQYVREKGFTVTDTKVMAAGDATFYAGWTLHSAGPNRSNKMREVMTIIYFADGARILEPDNPNRAADIERWHPGLKPGDLAASELNPVLYQRR